MQLFRLLTVKKESMKAGLFKDLITLGLDADLERLNPWWKNQPQPLLPEFKRWAFPIAMERLRTGLTKITVLTGPRQVGKSTLMRQIIQTLLDEGIHPKNIFCVQFDDLPEFKLEEPILRLSDWFEKQVLGKTFNQAAQEGQSAYLLLDEVQNLDNWASQLKFLVDNSAVRVMVTGSSALRIEAGRDSLAGRISTIEMGPLFLREIMGIRNEGNINSFLPYGDLSGLKNKDFWRNLREFGLQNKDIRDRAFSAFSQRGAYPIAHARPDVNLMRPS
jgi:predicted AAA+ superfamily ATPase